MSKSHGPFLFGGVRVDIGGTACSWQLRRHRLQIYDTDKHERFIQAAAPEHNRLLLIKIRKLETKQVQTNQSALPARSADVVSFNVGVLINGMLCQSSTIMKKCE